MAILTRSTTTQVPVTDGEVIVPATTTTTSSEAIQPTRKESENIENFYLINKVNYFLYVILAIIEFFILARTLLIFLGANRVGIVDFIYNVSHPFVAPFLGIFNRTPQVSGYYLEWESLIAALFYVILFGIITMVINLFRERHQY